MFYLPYSGRRYYLLDNELYHAATGEKIPAVNGKCRICWVHGDQDYELNVIIYLCITGASVPDHLINEMTIVFGDGDSKNLSPENIRYTFKKPIECPEKPGFFYLPGYNKYVVNEQGDLFSLTTGEFKLWTVHPGTIQNNRRGGYLYANLVDDYGKQTKTTRHRTLLTSFKGLPNNWDKLVCNHINGIKGDDWLDNLEWVTYGENNQHAIDAGLRNNGCTAFLVKNLKDNTITRYVSMEAAAKGVGYPKGVVRYRIEKNIDVLYEDYLQFKKDDGTEWKDFVSTIPQPLVYNVEITAYDVKNNKIVIFPNSTIASKTIGATTTQVLQHCYNTEGKTLLNGFYARETKNFVMPVYTEARLNVLRKNGYRNGKMCNVYSGEVLVFDGLVTDFARQANVNIAKLYAALNSGGLADGKYKLKLLE